MWGVALSCIRTIPRFTLMCGIAAGWRTKFWYLAAFRFWWIGTMGVFVCNDIPAHFITEPPTNCKLNLDSSVRELDPNLQGYTSDDVLSKLNEAVCVWLTTPSLHMVVSHAILNPSACFEQFGHWRAFQAFRKCAVLLRLLLDSFPKVSYTNVAVLDCEVNRQHFRLRWTSGQALELFCRPC